eukprot:PhM_4_TR7890/c0_g1_i1/m.1254
MFTLLAATDVFGEKMNLELIFPARPSLQELRQNCESVFGIECNLRRPQGHPKTQFRAVHFQVYDGVMRLWVDLVSCTQLNPWSQVYVFQRESYWHADTPGPIPQPAHGKQMLALTGPDYERARFVFRQIDRDGDGIVYFDDLNYAFTNTFSFSFSESTIRDFFLKADADNDGRVNTADFMSFCTLYPQILDTMFFQASDTETRAKLIHSKDPTNFLPQATLDKVRETTQMLSVEKKREEELQLQLTEARQAVARLENEVKGIAMLESASPSSATGGMTFLRKQDAALDQELREIRRRHEELKEREYALMKMRDELHGKAYY